MSEFFISRPIFAWVLAIAVMLLGAFAVKSLPIAQYPSIAPPSVAITVNYRGASAETVQDTVVQVIEQELSGIDKLLYFSSGSDKDGSMRITLSFEQGADADIAQVQVQNKLSLATPLLPQEVQQQGIRVAKYTKNFQLVVGFVSNDGSMSNADVSDFIASSVQDPVSCTKARGSRIRGAHAALQPELHRVQADTAQAQAWAMSSLLGQLADASAAAIPQVERVPRVGAGGPDSAAVLSRKRHGRHRRRAHRSVRSTSVSLISSITT